MYRGLIYSRTGNGEKELADFNEAIRLNPGVAIIYLNRGLSYDHLTQYRRAIQDFVDDLSNWYVRRSRRRFWKSESDSDKQAAYSTLYTALVTVAKLLAPSMPFLAEELHQNLVRSADENAPESVHLAKWPEVLPEMIDESLNRDMELLVFGHAGARVLVFPTSMGRYYEWEDRGMMGALGEHIERGWIQVFSGRPGASGVSAVDEGPRSIGRARRWGPRSMSRQTRATTVVAGELACTASTTNAGPPGI